MAFTLAFSDNFLWQSEYSVYTLNKRTIIFKVTSCVKLNNEDRFDLLLLLWLQNRDCYISFMFLKMEIFGMSVMLWCFNPRLTTFSEYMTDAGNSVCLMISRYMHILVYPTNIRKLDGNNRIPTVNISLTVTMISQGCWQSRCVPRYLM